MRYVILSFDDGRKDFFVNALPILQKYGLTATLNVITEFIGRNDLDRFASGNHQCLDYDEISEIRDMGIEIACHSADHTNNIEKIIAGLDFLKEHWAGEYGFASPGSEIFSGNINRYASLLTKGDCKYIRSGRQLRRDGKIYALLYLIAKYTGSRWLFRLYNRKNLVDISKQYSVYPSVTCNSDTRAQQIVSLIKSLKENHACIIMFHSILYETDPGFGKDKWYNTVRDFDVICKTLQDEEGLEVITNMKLFELQRTDDE